MWWIIGAFVLVGLFWLFRKFRIVNNQFQIIQAAENQLRASLLTFDIGNREIADWVWQDRYLMGFAQGSIAFITQQYGHGLNTEQKGMVLVQAIKNLRPDDHAKILDQVLSWAEHKDEIFMHGGGDAMAVALLMSDNPTPKLLTDPDVQAAIDDAPALTELNRQLFPDEITSSTSFGTAGAALMHIYMDRHKEKLGLKN